MQKRALVIIDIQNDITKNYKEIIDNINKSIDWAEKRDIHVIYSTFPADISEQSLYK